MAGGAIGAMHIPEKWFPGCMDYYLNSHNIMHVLVVLAVYSMHQVSLEMKRRSFTRVSLPTAIFLSRLRFRTWIGCQKLSALWAT